MKRLRIAVPKGRLLQPSIDLFAAAGCQVPAPDELKSRRLVFQKEAIEWILVKDGDVPVYVEFGAADLGISGSDQILEHEADVLEPLELDFGRCRMMLIAAPGAPELGATTGQTIATKYPAIARRFLRRRGLHCDIVPLQGSVELAAVLSLSPYIIDLVETGETIRIHELQPVELIEWISPRLIVNRNAYRIDGERIRLLVNALRSACPNEDVA
jgi:ATP phosphoribosyltransferase